MHSLHPSTLCAGEQFGYHKGDGAIARYITGGAEAIHRNIQSYHERLHIGIKT